jgi:hypothetical protein
MEPAAQSRHVDAPIELEYEETKQGEQILVPPTEKAPGRQSEQLFVLCDAYLPAPQKKHCEDPSFGATKPRDDSHIEQMSSFPVKENVPILQLIQAFTVVLKY